MSSVNLVFTTIPSPHIGSSCGFSKEFAIPDAWVEEFSRLSELAVGNLSFTIYTQGNNDVRRQAEELISSFHKREDGIDLFLALVERSQNEEALSLATVVLRRCAIRHWTYNSLKYKNGGREGFADEIKNVIVRLLQLVIKNYNSLLVNSPRISNQVLYVMASLMKKGMAETPNLFYSMAQECLSMRDQWHVVLPLLTEVAREVGNPNSVGKLLIAWNVHIEVKKRFETDILSPLTRAVLENIQEYLQGSRRPSNASNASNYIESLIDDLKNPVKFLELALEWNFASSRSPALVQLDPWLSPPPEWNDIFFPDSGRQSIFWVFMTGIQAARSVDRKNLKESLHPFYFILLRMTYFNPPMSWKHIAGSPFDQAKSRKSLLTEKVYSPLFDSILQFINTSVFMRENSEDCEEIRDLTMSLFSLIENPSVDMLSLVDGTSTVLQTIPSLALSLMARSTTDFDSICDPLECCLKTWGALVEANYQIIREDRPSPWLQLAREAATSVATEFLTHYLGICEFKECGLETSWEAASPELREFLRIWAVIFRSSFSALQAYGNIMTDHINRYEAARRSPENPSVEEMDRLIDNVNYVLYLSAYLLVVSSGNNFTHGCSIPKEFLHNPQNECLVVPIFTKVMEFMTNEIERCKNGISVSHKMFETGIVILSRVAPVYLFGPVRKNEFLYPSLGSLEGGQKVLSVILEAIGNLMHLLPMEASLMEGCVYVLERLTSTNGVALAYLWDNNVFQKLLQTIPAICAHGDLPEELVSGYPHREHGCSPLLKLSYKNLKRLCQTFGAAASFSDVMKDIVKLHIDNDPTLIHRSGSLITAELAHSRQSSLLHLADTLKTSLFRLSEISAESPHPLVLNAICIDFSMAAGFSSSNAAKLNPDFAAWFSNILVLATRFMRKYLRSPEVVSCTLKFLRSLARNALRVFSDENLNLLLRETQAAVEMFVETYGNLVLSSRLEEDDFLRNAAHLFRLLLVIAAEEPYLKNRDIANLIPHLITLCIKTLTPVGFRIAAHPQSKGMLAYVNLIQTSLENQALLLVDSLDKASIEIIAKVLESGLFSENGRLRTPAYEAIHASIDCVVAQQRKMGFVSCSLNPPPEASDLFTDSPDPLHSFSRRMALMALEILRVALNPLLSVKELEWLSDAFFDVMLLVAVRAYQLRSFFSRFCDTYRRELGGDSAVEDKCEEMMMSLLKCSNEEASYADSSVKRRLKHFELKNQFRNEFGIFIIECSYK